MKTVVYQSYRTFNVPPWLHQCMRSVREWATLQGFDYRFVDDNFLTYAPQWYRQKVNEHVLLVSDLARLLLARALLSQGFERTIWIDADVVIFDPINFSIDINREYAFCREIWLDTSVNGRLICSQYVNNAVLVFVESNGFLDFYIHACQSIVSNKTQISRLEVGTRFLTAMHNLIGFPLLENVGLFNPLIMMDIARGSRASIQTYMRHSESPLYAANLCLALRNTKCRGVCMSDNFYEAALQKLLQTKGNIINQYYYRKVKPINIKTGAT